MAQFNPDLLLKDELSYEALLRGLPYSNVTVAELRKTLRENRPDIPSQLNRLSVVDFESERETCYHKYRELTSIAQTLRDEKSPAVILRTTQRIEHLTRRINNLLNWPGAKVTPPDVQKFAEEALQQLPEIMRELRRRSESFRREEIEEAMTKLNISPTQSPTQEQQSSAVNFQFLQESTIEPSKDRLTVSQVNTLPVTAAPLPNELENITSNYYVPPLLQTN